MRHLPAALSGVALFGATVLVSANASTPQGGASDATVETSQGVTVAGSQLREFDWAKMQVRARVVYVSSGPRTLGGRMIDNDLQTTFRFSASDISPTVIIELAESTELHRVTAVFKAEDARVDVYLLNELPKNARELGSPTATITDPPQDHGVATVNFSATSARYLALRWVRKKRDEPFEVAEISAFSNEPTDLVSDQDIHLASNTAATDPPIVPIVSP
jgi:hypothetical protein